MCRFNSVSSFECISLLVTDIPSAQGFFFRHPLLASYDYYWRVEYVVMRMRYQDMY
jgi:hypothetical protein